MGGTVVGKFNRGLSRGIEKIFVVEDAMAWNPNLRSKTAIL